MFFYSVCCACFFFAFLCKVYTKSLLFFFSLLKRKKEAKKEKRKDLAYPCLERQRMPRLAVFSQLTRNINRPEGEQAAAAAVTLPFLNAKLGGRVSGNLPLVAQLDRH